jgi:hypothetical protein
MVLNSALHISTDAHSSPPPTQHAMTGNIEDDEYVASVLKQDAKNATKKYDLVGIDAFNPRRCVVSLCTGHVIV